MKLILRLLAGIFGGLLVGMFGPEVLVRLFLTAQTFAGSVNQLCDSSYHSVLYFQRYRQFTWQ